MWGRHNLSSIFQAQVWTQHCRSLNQYWKHLTSVTSHMQMDRQDTRTRKNQAAFKKNKVPVWLHIPTTLEAEVQGLSGKYTQTELQY